MALVSPNGLWLTRSNATPRTDGVLEAVAKGELTFSSTLSTVTLGASGNASALIVRSNAVVVNADLTVLGTLEAVYASDLLVADRVIVVATGAPRNDATDLTDGTGFLIADPDADGTVDERSFRWRAGVSSSFYGYAAAAAGGASNGGAWEVRGGSLRVTAPAAAASGRPSRDVSVGLRVNQLDELELFKRVLPSACNGVEADASYRVVARFGGTGVVGGGSAIAFHTSVNPYA